MAKTMPIAAMGPSVLSECRSLKSRHSRPAITVAPEASTDFSVPFSAATLASARLDMERRDLRCLAT